LKVRHTAALNIVILAPHYLDPTALERGRYQATAGLSHLQHRRLKGRRLAAAAGPNSAATATAAADALVLAIRAAALFE